MKKILLLGSLMLVVLTTGCGKSVDYDKELKARGKEFYEEYIKGSTSNTYVNDITLELMRNPNVSGIDLKKLEDCSDDTTVRVTQKLDKEGNPLPDVDKVEVLKKNCEKEKK